ncbi:NADH dehydrogenase [ubiquinone] 1 beta subcomplex subunit 3 [Epargyreus clarus]|uniref:NADH dehydrogenase [ubiquinone] 1 beta subcomplex subunit 3 n=1 Tax=Epargyreus clarus TaxID=520877 RepID=UPI003C301922
MGGHGHGPPYTVPHYSQFQVQGIPQLEELEKALAKKGLKDPWIRNETWRYHPGFGTRFQRARKVFFRGFPLGLALTVATVGLRKMFGSDDHHGHGHDGDHH